MAMLEDHEVQEIKAAMERLSLSDAELARRVGVSQSTIWRWLNAGQQPDRFRLRALRAAMKRLESS